MKKGILKRCVALALVFAMVFTAADLSGIGTVKAASSEKTITEAQLIANNYELTNEEKAVLNSEAINSVEHAYVAPTDSDALTTVDSDNKVVYIKSFEKNGYVWTPEKVEIVVGDDVKETVTEITKEAGVGNYADYDYQASFTCTEDGYQVKVYYNLYIAVDDDVQEYLMNVPYYLADGMNNMNNIKETAGYMDIIVTAIASYLSGLGIFQDGTRSDNIIDGWVDENAKYGTSKLTNMLNLEKIGYNKADSKIENIISQGASYRAEAEKTYDDLIYIAAQPLVPQAYENMLLDYSAPLEAVVKSNWYILNMEDILVNGLTLEKYAELDSIVAVAINKSNNYVTVDIPETEEDVLVTLKDSLLADTAMVSCSVNRYNVEVTVAATVINEKNEEVALENGTVTLNLASNTSDDDILATLANIGIEDNMIADWNALNGGLYAINTTNYDRTVTTLPEVLTEDITYTIKYTPKNFTVEYTDAELTDENVPYGTTITFPKSTIEGQTYEYTIDGDSKIHEEGTTHRVTTDITVSRTLGKAKTPLRVYDLIKEYYADSLTSEEEVLLENQALTSEYVYIRMPGDELVTLNGIDSVTVQSYNAGNGMYWEPVAAYVKDGATTVQTITSFDQDGNALITADNFTSVDVEYKLQVDVSNAYILEALNLPFEVVTDAKDQLAGMKSLAGKYDDLKQVTVALLDVAKKDLNEQSQAAIEDIAANGVGSDGNNLALTEYAYALKTNPDLQTDAAKLNYYYSNDMATKLDAQAKLVAKNIAIIVEDPDLPSVLEKYGQGDKVEMLEDVSSILDTLVSAFPPVNEKINPNNGQYDALLSLLVAGKDVKTHNSANGLYCTETITKTAPNRASVSVSVVILDETGNVVKQDSYSENFAKTVGMSASDIAKFNGKVSAMEAAMGVDKTHYSESVTGTLPGAGEALENNVSVVHTWTPKTYTVKIEGAQDQTIYYNTPVVTLPASANANLKYRYKIGSVTVDVTTESQTYRIPATEFDSLFVNGTYIITRETIDVQAERVHNLIKELNNTLVSEGLADTVSFIPFEAEDGSISIVLRINPFASDIASALESAVTVLVKETSYLALGGNTLRDSDGIYTEVLVDTILTSGISTDSLIALIDANGNIKENLEDVIEGTVITETIGGVPSSDKLGGLLLGTTVAITKPEADSNYDMPLHITMQDFDANAKELLDVKTALETAKPYLYFELAGGNVNVELTTPEKVHEAYLAAMLLQGETELKDFTVPSLADMVTYGKTIVEPIINDTAVTATTISNTVAQISADTDISGYTSTVNRVLDLLRSFIDSDTTNGEITSTVDDTTSHNAYTADATYPIAKIVEKAGLPSGVADLLVGNADGNVEIPLNVVLTNCDTEYTAAIIDIKAEGLINKADFTTAKTITTTNDNTVIALLADVDTITANGKTYLDLNGHKVTTLIANAKVTVVDSGLSSTDVGSITTVNGDVALTAGKYAAGVDLPDGYVQDANGYVSNRFYTITENAAGDYTLEIKGDFLSTEDPTAWKTVAVEMAVDVLLNGYTWSKVTVDGSHEIYAIELLDLVAQYKAGLGSMAGVVVEEVNCEGLTWLANDLLATITNFASIENAINAGSDIKAYTLTTAPWKITATVEGKGNNNYIAANLTSGAESDLKLSVKVADEDNEALAALCGELADIITFNKLEMSIEDLTYNSEGFDFTAGAEADVVVDFTKSDYAEEYLAVMGIIMANGMTDGNAKNNMVSAVNAYLAEITADTQNALIEEIEALTSAQIITSLEKASGVEFNTMVSKLGIAGADNAETLEGVYHDALSIGYILVNKLGVDGGAAKVGSYAQSEYATYKIGPKTWKTITGTLEVILAKEIVEDAAPVIVAPEKPQFGNVMKGFAYDADAKEIYIDVDWKGITDAQFEQYIRFATTDAEGYTLAFNKTTASDLVCTGNTVTVTAYNGTKTDVETYTIIVVGDVNKDGASTATDASAIGAYVVGKYNIEGAAAKAANINRSTEYLITVSDAKLIQDKFLFQETYKSLFQ